MAPRKPPTMAEKLGAALLEVDRLRSLIERDYERIPREIAAQLTAYQINSLFHFDHDAGFACHGTNNHPTKLTPKLIPEHWEKTRKVDQGVIAKVERISKEHRDFQARVLAKKTGQGSAPPRPKAWRWSKASQWPKGRKLQSRNNLRKVKAGA
jgi:hypothetical protein